MKKECGFYTVDTEIKTKENKRYFVFVHKCNPKYVELVFIDGGLRGREDLCEFTKNELLNQ